MKRLFPMSADAAVAFLTAAASLPFPPTAGQVAIVPAGWTSEGAGGAGVVPKFDLRIWAAGSCSLTGAELFGGYARALTIADTTVDSVDHTTDTFTEATHGWKTGDGPVRLNWATTQPAEISGSANYWIIRTGVSTFKIATSLADALAGTALAFSGNGVGALTLSDVQGSTDADDDTHRVHWESHGLLDATIALDVDRDWSVRCDHSPGIIAYALTGTLSASTASSSLTPVMER